MLNILNGGTPMWECTQLSLLLSPLDCHVWHWCGPGGYNRLLPTVYLRLCWLRYHCGTRLLSAFFAEKLNRVILTWTLIVCRENFYFAWKLWLLSCMFMRKTWFLFRITERWCSSLTAWSCLYSLYLVTRWYALMYYSQGQKWVSDSMRYRHFLGRLKTMPPLLFWEIPSPCVATGPIWSQCAPAHPP